MIKGRYFYEIHKINCACHGPIAVFAGCSKAASTGLKDGVYTAEMKDYADSGWKDVVTTTIEKGKIVSGVTVHVNESLELAAEAINQAK